MDGTNRSPACDDLQKADTPSGQNKPASSAIRMGWLLGLALVGALCLTSAVLLLRAFNEIEDQSIRQNVARARNALSRATDEVNATTGDYGTWDVTYTYAETGDVAYPAAELTGASLSKLNIDAVWVVNQRGKVLFASGFDGAGNAKDAPATITARIAQGDAGPLALATGRSQIVGLAAMPEGPMLIACRPILKTNGAGPSRGMLIMGRAVDATFMRQLAELTQVSVTIGTDQAAAADVQPGGVTVQKLDHSRMCAFATVPDVLGGTAVVLRVDSLRPIHRQGWVTILYFSAALLVIVLLFFGALSALTNRLWRVQEARGRMQAAKETAEAASAAKDRLLATVSHELRTPLTPVLVTLSMLQDDPKVPPTLLKDISMMRGRIELEATLIDGLLDLTRVTRGKVRLKPELLDAHALVDRAMAVAMQDADAHRPTVQWELKAAEHFVWADPTRLQQVCWNIIKNALQYTPDSGTLHIRSRNTAGAGVSEGTMLELEFADTGAGIEPEFLLRIFKEFERGQHGQLHRSGGLGLGLSIARSLIEQLGGSIGAASEGPGKGATFTVRLPVAQGSIGDRPAELPWPVREAAGDAIAQGERASGPSLRILLVEDDTHTANILARVLRRFGYQVSIAATVEQALAAGERESFDLLLSDIGLPDGSGLDVMRWFSTRQPIPGIALSGYAAPTDLQRSQDAGFLMHLVKPVAIDVLCAAIEKAHAASKKQCKADTGSQTGAV